MQRSLVVGLIGANLFVMIQNPKNRQDVIKSCFSGFVVGFSFNAILVESFMEKISEQTELLKEILSRFEN